MENLRNVYSKDEFIAIMGENQKAWDFQDKLNSLFYEYKMDCSVVSKNEIEVIIRTLGKMFMDKADWIGYFVCDLDFGKNYEDGCIEVDGKNVSMKNAGELWDILMENMEDGLRKAENDIKFE